VCQLYENDSTSTAPVLLMTSAGADPTKELAEFAGRTVGKER
jgi:hypothetical protein